MAKVFTYVIIMAGLVTVLSYMGINTGFNGLLEATGLIDNPQNFQSSTLFTSFIGILTGLGAAVIIVGLITRQSTESILIAPFVVLLFGFAGSIYYVIAYANGLSGDPVSGFAIKIIGVVMGALTLGYIVSLVSYWRGAE